MMKQVIFTLAERETAVFTHIRRSKSKTGYVSEKVFINAATAKIAPTKRVYKGNNCKTPIEERNKVLSVAKTFS